jgi:hypothetical protein
MATDKKGFILYADQKDLFDQLTNDKAGELIKHIFSYVNDESPESKDIIINLAFTPIKQQLKRDLKKFESKKVARIEAGRLGGLAKASKASDAKQKLANLAVNGTVTVNVKDNVTVNDTVIDNKDSVEQVQPKAISEVSVFRSIFEEEYLRKKGIDFYWNVSEATSCKSLIKKLKHLYKSENYEWNPENSKNSLIGMINVKDNWIQDNLSMKILNSKFNEIVNTLKNGKSKKGFDSKKRGAELEQVLRDRYEDELNQDQENAV